MAITEPSKYVNVHSFNRIPTYDTETVENLLAITETALLTAWLQRPKARVTLAQVDVSDNRIDEACAKTLRAVAEKEGCEILGV